MKAKELLRDLSNSSIPNEQFGVCEIESAVDIKILFGDNAVVGTVPEPGDYLYIYDDSLKLAIATSLVKVEDTEIWLYRID